jgi:hypothetical protein
MSCLVLLTTAACMHQHSFAGLGCAECTRQLRGSTYLWAQCALYDACGSRWPADTNAAWLARVEALSTRIGASRADGAGVSRARSHRAVARKAHTFFFGLGYINRQEHAWRAEVCSKDAICGIVGPGSAPGAGWTRCALPPSEPCTPCARRA